MYDDQTNSPSDAQSSPILGADQNAQPMGMGAGPAAGYPAVTTYSPQQTHPDPTLTPMPGSPAPELGAPAGPPAATALNDDLIAIKKKALDELSPLVGKLNQSPEEKYKTIMMMIQASDNQSMVNEAYQAAQQITDEKARAEALLNIVNEINYFTQKSA